MQKTSLRALRLSFFLYLYTYMSTAHFTGLSSPLIAYLNVSYPWIISSVDVNVDIVCETSVIYRLRYSISTIKVVVKQC